MSTIWEETKTQGAKMKGRPLREKLEYFWEYYKIHTLVTATILFIVISLIHAWATSKDYALSIVVANSMINSMEGVSEGWKSDLTDILDFDTKKYEVGIDTSVMLGVDTASADQEYSSSQKMAAMLSAESIDIIITDSQMFEQYAQNQYLHDLRDLYTAEELATMEGRIYYTDAATYSDYDSAETDVLSIQAAYVTDHRDPSSMKQPIPVGIYADKSTRIGKSEIYFNLDAAAPFQGHPREAVIGIPINTPRVEAAVAGVEYFTGD